MERFEFNPLAEINIACKKHGQFYQTPLNHLIGYGCPICDSEYPCCLQERLLNTMEKLMSE